MKYDQEKLLATYAEVKSVKKVAKIFKCSTGTVMNYIDILEKSFIIFQHKKREDLNK